MASCVLHNMLSNNKSVIDESWKAVMGVAVKECRNNSTLPVILSHLPMCFITCADVILSHPRKYALQLLNQLP